VDIGNLSEGTRVHGYMCVHPDSVLAILMENWEGHSRPFATLELQRFNTRRAFPIDRGLLGSSLIGSVQTVDQAKEDADRTNDTSIGTERSNTEGADERTEDDGSIISGKSDVTIRTTKSQLDQAASETLRHYLMMDPNIRIEFSESPADYVIYLFNKALVCFAGRIQIPMSLNMEEGVCKFYSQSSCPTLAILMTQASNVAWRATFKTTMLDYFTSFFPLSSYRDLQIQAMVRIPMTLAVYARRYTLRKTNHPLSSACMLNVKEFWDIWEQKAEDLRLEMSQRIDDMDTTRRQDPSQSQKVQSPPTPVRTNTSTDTLTPPGEGGDESEAERTFDDLSPITQKEDTKQPWRAPDLPFPTMEPPKQYIHCIGWYERSTGGKIYWRSRFPIITLENLPRNLKFIDSHWTGHILPDGTTFLGRYPHGQPSFGLPIRTDHTRKAPETSGKTPEPTKKVDQIPPTQRSDPVIPGSDPVTQPPRQATNDSNLRPGTYTPGGTPKVLAFQD
jgi:hypothetical protein